MANNGNRQGGGAGGGNQTMNEHVEFTVKAEEDLYLTGSEHTLLRVAAETNYSCLMLKTQRFSSLFRHYAKYHGLRKDDLEYYFVNPLENEDTPESVQLQRSDTIMVRKRRKPETPEAASDDSEFFRDMKELLDDEEHMDAVFLVHPGSSTNISKKVSPAIAVAGTKREINEPSPTKSLDCCVSSDPMLVDSDAEKPVKGKIPFIEVRAHKCVLTARAGYFKALFRKEAFRESSDCTINVEDFSAHIVRLTLEFIYTNRIEKISKISTDDLLSLLHLSDIWLLRDLKRLTEHELSRSRMDVNSVARMYGATEDHNAPRLSKACLDFIMENIHEVTANVAFQEEMQHHSHLFIPVLKAAADRMNGQPNKKQRTGDYLGAPVSTPTAGAVSSPVPDSDA